MMRRVLLMWGFGDGMVEVVNGDLEEWLDMRKRMWGLREGGVYGG